MCIYTKTNGVTCVIINLYVDDMLIFGTNKSCVEDTKRLLSSKFNIIKDLGVVDVNFGIKIIINDNGIVISQFIYIEKVLRRFNMFDCTPKTTHVNTNFKFNDE